MPSLLIVSLNGKEICQVGQSEIPIEKHASAFSEANGRVLFTDSGGVRHNHDLGKIFGWFHFSIRVHQNLVCQIDCVVTDSEKYEPSLFSEGRATGIRFQPFFCTGAAVRNQEFRGKGLFARGLHFGGMVTQGNVILSCECDWCEKSFQIRSFHAGFGHCGYFYSDSGKYTLIVSGDIEGCPAPLSTPDLVKLAKLESVLPKAPDGSAFKYRNPFRCPHCGRSYIDFDAYPQSRTTEYYDNYFVGSEPIRYDTAKH